MTLVVLVSLLLYLLEYNSPLFRALSYDVQCIYGTICKKKYVLKFMYGFKNGTFARPLQQEGLGHFYPDIFFQENANNVA